MKNFYFEIITGNQTKSKMRFLAKVGNPCCKIGENEQNLQKFEF